MGSAHRLAGAAAGAGWATYTHQSWGAVAAAAALATLTAAGPLSPDMDQTRAWRAIPGRGGILAHRAITHWWPWPFLAWFLIPHTLIPAALMLGWISHLAGDALFGRIPLSPLGSWRFGLKLRTGGGIETALVTPILAVGVLYLVVWAPVASLVRSW